MSLMVGKFTLTSEKVCNLRTAKQSIGILTSLSYC